MKNELSMGDFVRARKLGIATDRTNPHVAQIGGIPAWDNPAERNAMTDLAITLRADNPAARRTNKP